jgi:hypothetical protein
MNWFHWWYNLAAHLVSFSKAWNVLANVNVKHRSTSPSRIQVKNWWKTTGTEEKLYTKNLLKKGERTADICHNVRLAHHSVGTICDNADIIKESSKWLGKIQCQQSKTGTVC